MSSVNIKDVAALAGVSIGTVSNVLNRPERVSPESRERVHTAIEKLGYVRNDAARQLRAGHSRSIGMIVLDVGNPFFTDVAHGAETRASVDGYSLLLASSDEDTSREQVYLDLFQEQRVHGMLITPHGDVVSQLIALRRLGIPTVLVDRQTENRTFSSVAMDDVAGGRLAAQHLIDVGRRRLAFVGGPRSLRQVADRLAGARTVVHQASGVTLETLGTSALTVDEGRAAAETLLNRPESERPDAIFAANDLLAIGILQTLTMSGAVAIPNDMALIGYDDISFAASSAVPLSSVRQPTALIGETAVDLLLREAQAAGDENFEHEQIVFQPELVVRASTSAGRTA
jgi:LacI family transcriptional regulator